MMDFEERVNSYSKYVNKDALRLLRNMSEDQRAHFAERLQAECALGAVPANPHLLELVRKEVGRD
jgi:hypothetical protein